MLKSSAKKEYQEKIKQYKKYNKKYFEDSAPIVSDQDFDIFKRETTDKWMKQIMNIIGEK